MVDILNADYRSLKPACEALLAGKVIAFPTETVYGIGALIDNEAGLEMMRTIKGRDADKPFQILIPKVDYASKYADVDHPGAEALMNTFWPGAMTLVLPGKDGGTAGLRMPDNKWLRLLMLELGSGLVATSANISGETPATSADEINEELGGYLGLVINGGKAVIGESSTVVGISNDNKLEVFREGAIPQSEIEKVFLQS